MLQEWIAMEHYRMHVIEQWPDTPARAAALAAVRSTLKSLEGSSTACAERYRCCECG